MTATRLDDLAQANAVLKDSVDICDDLLADLVGYNNLLPGFPHWEAIQLRLEEIIRLYGSSMKVTAEAFEAEKQRQQQPEEEEVSLGGSCVTAELTDLIDNLVQEATESGTSKNITLTIAIDSEPAPTVH